MHVSVQKFTSTTCPRSSAGPSASELSHPVAPSSEGMWTREKTAMGLANRPERCSELVREELRLLPGGEVAPPVDLVEVSEAGVGRLGPAARGSPDLAGERREADGNGRRRRGLAGRACAGSPVIPVVPGRRGPGTCQPVQRDVVEDVVPGEVASRLPVDEGAGDLVVAVGVVVEQPGRQGDG